MLDILQTNGRRTMIPSEDLSSEPSCDHVIIRPM